MAFRISLCSIAFFLIGCAETKAAPEETKANQNPVQVARAPASQPAQATPEKFQKGVTVDDRDQIDADQIVRRGYKIPKGKSLSVGDCVSQAKKLDGNMVKVAGTASQVCAKKGCWWMLSGDKPNETIRITAAEYGFFVPRAVKGKQATVYGKLEVKHMSKAEAQHLADDAKEAGQKPAEGPLPTVELRLTAHSLEMKPKS